MTGEEAIKWAEELAEKVFGDTYLTEAALDDPRVFAGVAATLKHSGVSDEELFKKAAAGDLDADWTQISFCQLDSR